MSSGLYSALSAGIAKMQALDIETNNLSNVNTLGYKKDGFTFDALFRQATQDVTGRGINFVKIPKDTIDFSQGTSQYTGNPLDLAIQGQGFFKLRSPDGSYYYTRLGQFQRDADGDLASANGWKVMNDQNKPIAIPAGGNVTVEQSGKIMSQGNEVGTIPLFTVKNLNQFSKQGKDLFVLPAGAKDSVLTNARMLSKHLEGSNVQPLQAMAQMIDGLRSFQAYQKVIKTYNNLLSEANQLGAVS